MQVIFYVVNLDISFESFVWEVVLDMVFRHRRKMVVD
jgi:hypothetical protein